MSDPDGPHAPVSTEVPSEFDTGSTISALSDAPPALDPLRRAVTRSRTETALFGSAEAVKIGRYTLIERAGAGAMGVVWSAWDPELGRGVALKLASSQREAARVRARDEGRALARLSHPNVVPIFDVLETPAGVFLVMELVTGTSLSSFVASGPRPLEIVRAYQQAGQGLAAAHRAGLIHRDFKPDNVIVGADARVRVLDFGLAHAVTGDEPSATREIAGTPHYMAPEQRAGLPLTAAVDQYAFCVALREGLGAAVPAWIVPILARGSAEAPADRYPSMDELLRDLANDPSTRRRRRVTVGAVVLSVGAVAAAFTLGRARREDVPALAQTCGGHDRAEAMWHGTRDAVRVSVLGTSSPMARDAWATVDRTLDTYVDRWSAMHRDACAARHSGAQSDALVDLRLRCLDHSLEEATELGRLLTHADAEMVSRVSRGVLSLGAIDECADVTSLASETALPADPNRRREVDRLRSQLSRSAALALAGRYKEQVTSLVTLVPEIVAVGYAPLTGEALYAQATALDKTAEFARAADVMRAAGYAADEGGARKLAARARVELVWLAGHEQSQFERGLEYGHDAEARIKGLGGDADLESALASNLGVVEGDMDHRAAAEVLARKALAIREAAFGPDDVRTSIARVNVSVSLLVAGKFAEALALTQRSLESYRKVLGEHHPLYAHTLFDIADAERMLGRYDAAFTHARDALALIVQILGPEHNLVASAEHVLALVEISRGNLHEAELHARRALAIGEKVRGATHPFVANYALTLADALLAAGRPAEALQAATRSSEISAKLDDKLSVARAQASIGEARAELGERQAAIEILQASITGLLVEPAADPVALAQARFALARVLAADPTTLPHARELAALAASTANAADGERIAAWRRAHP